jgi:hypothetical protein
MTAAGGVTYMAWKYTIDAKHCLATYTRPRKLRETVLQ